MNRYSTAFPQYFQTCVFLVSVCGVQPSIPHSSWVTHDSAESAGHFAQGSIQMLVCDSGYIFQDYETWTLVYQCDYNIWILLSSWSRNDSPICVEDCMYKMDHILNVIVFVFSRNMYT